MLNGFANPDDLETGPWPPLAALTRFANRRPLIFDITLTTLVDVAASMQLIVGGESRWWVWLLGQLLVLPLIARRWNPSAVFAVLSLIALVQWLADVPLAADAGLLVALYTVAAHEPRGRALADAGVLEVGVVLASLRFVPASDGLLGSLVFLSGLVCAALFGGIALSTHRAYLASLVDRTRRLELERDQQAQLAATAERTRIAREMHDIVAHSLSVIIALSDGAGSANRDGSLEATDAMRKVSETGRDALTEMRRLLGVLRDDASTVGRAPQPSLELLSDLTNQVRAAGLPVQLNTVGRRRSLPATAEATAYRIVQEGLTNTLKHAVEATSVSLTLEWTDTDLTIEITDDGRRTSDRGAWTGHGLIGMAERAKLFGGSASAGPLQHGGWQVVATLPLQPTDLPREVSTR